MNILFVHQNFPAQFKHLAKALVANGHKVTVLTARTDLREQFGLRIVSYNIKRPSTKGIHPWVIEIETKTIRGEACYNKATELKKEGLYKSERIISSIQSTQINSENKKVINSIFIYKIDTVKCYFKKK